ncbi:MAG: nitrile hydratase subunit alpha [Gammaproteobacteria bacterium]|nr:nitrile hydratase subunit alpha [Gammaproteobacteria bacterium]
MSDHHDHDHDRTFQPDHAEPTSDGARLGLALRELLIEAGHYTADEERQVIEAMQGASSQNGAKIVARAWTDPGYRERLLDNGIEAIKELGFDLQPYEFTVMENTDDTHNVIVCTLCSCYPRALLGMSPAWYKSGSYRARVVREPRSVLREFGVELSDDVEVRVHDSTAELRYMVLPQRPDGTEDWSEEDLAKLVTRDSLIGTQRELGQ